MRIYLAGPMRGVKYYNFPEFDKVARFYERMGDTVLNPAQMDRDVGFDAMKLQENSDWDAIPEQFSFKDCVKRDLDAIQTCDAIHMLAGWERSMGAKAEKAVAEWLGLKVFFTEDLTWNG